ncbi:MAG: protein tyrosine phosphatase [Lachnospira sp.]
MNRFKKVIYVCMGNTCRSPMAATIMRNLMPDMIVESRGMVVLFEEPYNPKAVAVASQHNMIMTSDVSMQISNDDFSGETLVLTMDAVMKQKIYDTFDKAINVFFIGEFVGEADVVIPDPYGKGMEEYSKCFDGIYRLVEKVTGILESEKESKDNDSNRM